MATKLIIPTILLLFSVGASTAGDVEKVEIYYTPFRIESFETITPENIARTAMTSVTVFSDNIVLKEIMAILEGAERGVFDGTIVRAVFKFSDGRAFFIDSRGGVRTYIFARKVDSEKLAMLSKLIEKIMSEERKNWPVLELLSPGKNNN